MMVTSIDIHAQMTKHKNKLIEICTQNICQNYLWVNINDDFKKQSEHKWNGKKII